jgi:hypothetical protein
MEVEELVGGKVGGEGRLIGRFSRDPRERRRLYKGVYYEMPLLWRAVGYFIYRYVFLLGFMDGSIGFLYAVFQALWFRLLVDAKFMELRVEPKGDIA